MSLALGYLLNSLCINLCTLFAFSFYYFNISLLGLCVRSVKNLFPKRKIYHFNKEELKSLKLREFEGGNRLTIDKGVDRIEIAPHLLEIMKTFNK